MANLTNVANAGEPPRRERGSQLSKRQDVFPFEPTRRRRGREDPIFAAVRLERPAPCGSTRIRALFQELFAHPRDIETPVSSSSMTGLSLQPSPSSETSTFNTMRLQSRSAGAPGPCSRFWKTSNALPNDNGLEMARRPLRLTQAADYSGMGVHSQSCQTATCHLKKPVGLADPPWSLGRAFGPLTL